MQKRISIILVALLSVLVSSAFAASELQTDFSQGKLNSAYQGGNWATRTDYFLLVQDVSWSMHCKDHFNQGRNLANQVNYAIPQMKLSSAVYSFGEDGGFFSYEPCRKVWGIDAYSRGAFENALRSLAEVGKGGSRVDKALMAIDADLKTVAPGQVAILIISDGETFFEESAINAVRTLKADYGGKLCIYTAQIGTSSDGQALLEALVKEAGCGRAVKASELDADATDALVAEMLLKKSVKKAPLDSDGDGVIDELDKCPNTPKNTAVDAKGCPIVKAEPVKEAAWVFDGSVLFDPGKADLKPAALPLLDDVAKAMLAKPDMKVKICGHTDNTGSPAVNNALSLKRARAVSAYLQKKDVAADRLATEGMGFTKPVADNASAEGRTKNRRVEIMQVK